MKKIIIYSLFLFLNNQTVSNRQFIADVNDCIRFGVNVDAESFITNEDINFLRCGFIMRANEYIVLQPYFMNLNSYKDIKLFLISRNLSNISITLIREFYGQYLYKNMVFIGQGHAMFALYVPVKKSIDARKFRFLFRTKCFVEMAAEDYPLFSSPIYYFANNRNHDVPYGSYCTYRIYSRDKYPFNIKFYYKNNEYRLLLNNKSVIIGKIYSFSAVSNVTVAMSYDGFITGIDGFNASVDVVFPLQLYPIDGEGAQGIPQIKILGRMFSFQDGSLYDIDAHVLCLSLGFGGLKSMRGYVNESNPLLLNHQFQCLGSEKHLSQCVQIIPQNIYYNRHYFTNSKVTFIQCSENLHIRLINGTSNSSGIVQVKIGHRWGFLCGKIIDYNIGDILCRELGFSRVLELNKMLYNPDHWKDIIMMNIRCGQHKSLKNCGYDYWDPYINCNKKPLTTCHYNFNYYTDCLQTILTIHCRNTNNFSLVPERFKGFLRYKNEMVCSTLLTDQNADVYCKSWGYAGSRNIVSADPLYTESYLKINLMCNGTELSAVDCLRKRNSTCPENKILWVTCQTVELIGNGASNKGHVKIFYKGLHGLLCADSYNMKNGHVICRQLGFSQAENILYSDQNFHANYPFYLMTNLNCQGNEDSIDECPHGQWGQRSCSYEDTYELVCANSSNKYLKDSCGQDSHFETVPDAVYRPWPSKNPAQVNLLIENEIWCGATILNRNWLISSANCLSMPSFIFKLYSGVLFRRWKDRNYIKSIFIHPFYSQVTGDYNIALLKTYLMINYHGSVKPICLPSNTSFINYNQCVTTGRRHKSFFFGGKMMREDVKMKSFESCMTCTKFSRDKMSRYLCSGRKTNPAVGFSGESGGPLYCKINGKNTLVGVVDQSLGGPVAMGYRLYSRVDYYVDWIRETMAQN